MYMNVKLFFAKISGVVVSATASKLSTSVALHASGRRLLVAFLTLSQLVFCAGRRLTKGLSGVPGALLNQAPRPQESPTGTDRPWQGRFGAYQQTIFSWSNLSAHALGPLTR